MTGSGEYYIQCVDQRIRPGQWLAQAAKVRDREAATDTVLRLRVEELRVCGATHAGRGRQPAAARAAEEGSSHS